MTLKQLAKSALGLPDGDRAALAATLLSSLPAALSESDEGLGEASRRSADLDAAPETARSWDEVKSGLKR